MQRLSLLLASFALCTNALAGGWTSGGGELLESGINPWFIQAGGVPAKRVVRYCVEVDEANFGVGAHDLEKSIDNVFSSWRDDFASAYIPDNGAGNRVHVATESFFLAPNGCAPDIALRFQFGVLSPEQLQEFKEHGQDPTKIVAVAVRTSYDEARLDSKGFVYVSPPRGPLAMQARDVVEDPWSKDSGFRLISVLRHELGHLFGLQHSGTHRDVMGAGFPEYAVSVQGGWASTHGTFKVPLGADLLKICGAALTEFQRHYFGLPADYGCIAPRIWHDKFQIVARRTTTSPPLVIGEAPFSADVVRRSEPLVRLWLPTTQTIFKNVPPYLGSILAGPTVLRLQRTGTYTIKATGATRELTIHTAPDRIQIDGIWEGKQRLDLLPILAFRP